MTTSLLRHAVASIGMLCLVTGIPSAHAQTLETVADSMRVATDRASGRLTVFYRGRPVMIYAFATNQWKPYVKELRTLQGDDVLLDAPADHLHHHGLMYAIAVNGTNFWEEANDPGVQKPVAPPSVEAKSESGAPPSVIIRQPIHWIARVHRGLADTRPVALLEEDRTLTLTVDHRSGEVALRWQGAFTTGQGAPRAELTGSVYFGLGMRLARPFDGTAERLNSAATPYTAPNGGNEATAAFWTAMTQKLGDRDVTVAMFDQPANAGRSVFFSMLNGFAYVSGTQELDKVPLQYNRGEKFALDYLVTVRDRKLNTAELEKRYGDWLANGR